MTTNDWTEVVSPELDAVELAADAFERATYEMNDRERKAFYQGWTGKPAPALTPSPALYKVWAAGRAAQLAYLTNQEESK